MLHIIKEIIKSIRNYLKSFVVFLICKITKKDQFLIGKLNVKGKITHLVFYIEPILRKYRSKNLLILIINPGDIANYFIWNKYKEKINLIGPNEKYLRLLFLFIYRYLFQGTENDLALKDYLEKEYIYLYENKESSINFSKVEINRGEKLLKNIQLCNNEFVCFGLREKSFYKDRKDIEKDAGDNTHHRNPIHENYQKFIDSFINIDISVLRVGVIGEYKFKKQNKYFDYCNSKFRDDFNDIYLQHKSKFILAGGCGLFSIAVMLNKPHVQTDAYILFGGKSKRDLFIPKLLKNNKTGKYLNFSDMIQLGQRYMYSEFCEQDDISYIHNTPDEILDVANQMNKQIDNKYEPTSEDIYRQKKFRELFPPDNTKFFNYDEFFFKKNVIPPGSIGSEFLKKYEFLL